MGLAKGPATARVHTREKTRKFSVRLLRRERVWTVIYFLWLGGEYLQSVQRRT
jgi:hypothetical protein